MAATMRQAFRLFQLFSALCRRPLLVLELTRRPPFFLRPILVVNDRKLSTKASAANYRGMFVSGARGTVSQLACSKAVLLQPQDSREAWGEEAMHLVLPPVESPPLCDKLLSDIAAEFQPQLELFRLQSSNRRLFLALFRSFLLWVRWVTAPALRRPPCSSGWALVKAL